MSSHFVLACINANVGSRNGIGWSEQKSSGSREWICCCLGNSWNEELHFSSSFSSLANKAYHTQHPSFQPSMCMCDSFFSKTLNMVCPSDPVDVGRIQRKAQHLCLSALLSKSHDITGLTSVFHSTFLASSIMQCLFLRGSYTIMNQLLIRWWLKAKLQLLCCTVLLSPTLLYWPQSPGVLWDSGTFMFW